MIHIYVRSAQLFLNFSHCFLNVIVVITHEAEWWGTSFYMTAIIARLMVQFSSSLVVASLDKMIHGNYSCLVESNKQQIKEVRSKNSIGNSETKDIPKRVWICPMYSASVAFS